MLLEQMSGFDEAVAQLEAIITPVAAKMEPLLLPWAQLAEPLAQAWKAHYSQPDAIEKWCRRVRYSEDKPLEAMQIQLRYICPKPALGTVVDYSAFCHIGVAVLVEKPETATFDPWEYQAFRRDRKMWLA